MRILLLIATIILPGLMFGQRLPAADSIQIVAVISDWDNGWRTKNVELASKGYGDQATFINAFGDKKTGRSEVAALLREVFGLPFVMSGQSETVQHSFVVLSEQHVIVNTSVVRRGQLMPDGSAMADRRTSHLRVFGKDGPAWQIVAHLISDARDKQVPGH